VDDLEPLPDRSIDQLSRRRLTYLETLKAIDVFLVTSRDPRLSDVSMVFNFTSVRGWTAAVAKAIGMSESTLR
jgi:hypothetical protein